MKTRSLAPALAALAAVAALAPCSTLARDYARGAIRISHPWSPPTPNGAPTAAGYLVITNTGRRPDRLLGGSTPVAASLEVHSMSMRNGIASMRPVTGGLVIGPGQTVRLEPMGGYHLMLIGLKRPLRLGQTVPATLRFQHAGAIRIELGVEPRLAAPPPRGHAHMDKH